MNNQAEKEIIQTVTHKSTPNLQKIERDKRHKRREEWREKVITMHRRMDTRVTQHEGNPPELVHDWQEEGVYEEEVSPMEEYLWIEQREALHIEIPQEVRPPSPVNSNLSSQVQTILKEDLRLWAGEFDVWIRLDNEGNNVDHLVIRRPEEGKWVTFQTYPSNRSINLLYPENEGVPPCQTHI